MPVNPSNPPDQITNPLGALPTQLVQNGAFIGNANPLVVQISGGGGGGGTSTTVTNLYTVTTQFVDANGTCSVNDTLENVQTISPTGVITSSVWINLTKSFTLAANPPLADISLQSSSPLTNAQFQANFPLPNVLELAGSAVSSVNPLPVSLVSGGSQIQFVILQYTATANGSGYSIGDQLEQVQEWNVVTSPATYVTTVWRNASTNAAIATPTAGTYVPTSSTATSVAVTNLPATLGQKVTAGSTSVTLASDEVLPLPTGASTSALQTTANTTLTTIANDLAHGQALMANSVPVVLASDQSAVTVTSTQLPATLGAKLIATSTSVNIASDQVVPISATTLPLPTGAATAALQTTGNTSLATIATETTAIAGQLPASLGNKLSIGSLSTTIASDDAVSTGVTAINNKLKDDGSGNLLVNVAAGTISAENPSVSQTGNAVPTYGTYLAANVSGNLTGLTATANGLKVDGSAVTQPVSSVQLPPALGPQSSANSLSVYVQNPSSGAVAATNNYTVITQFTLGSVTCNVGDYLQELIIYNASGVYVATDWFNLTQGVPLTGNPPFANLSLVAGSSATSALQVTGNASLASIDSKTPALVGGNQPVAVVSALPAGTNNIGSVTSVQATAANFNATVVTTGGATLATAAQLPTTVGQTVKANSLSVAIASDNTVAISSAQLPAALGSTTKSGSVSVTLASDQGAIPVTSTTPASVTVIQQTLTATAVQLASASLTNGVAISAPSSNVGNAYVGTSGVTAATGFILNPGASLSFSVANLNAVYVLGTTGDILSIAAN